MRVVEPLVFAEAVRGRGAPCEGVDGVSVPFGDVVCGGRECTIRIDAHAAHGVDANATTHFVSLLIAQVVVGAHRYTIFPHLRYGVDGVVDVCESV